MYTTLILSAESPSQAMADQKWEQIDNLGNIMTTMGKENLQIAIQIKVGVLDLTFLLIDAQ